MGFKDFQVGEVLTSQDVDNFLMRQSVMRFADASARDTAIGTALAEGMIAYLDDTDEVLKYDGSNWIDISGDITGVTAGTALTGGGTSGNVTLDVDTAAVGSAIGIDSKQDNVITTQGDLVIGDASGDPSRLAIGTADQVLTSNGTTMTWADAGGGGGWELITSVDATGTTGLTVSGISSDYKAIYIIYGNVIPTVDAQLLLRIGDSTPTYFFFYTTTMRAQGSSWISQRSTTLEISDREQRDDSDALRGWFNYYGWNAPNTTLGGGGWISSAAGRDITDGYFSEFQAGSLSSTLANPLDTITMYMSTGTLTSGNFYVYGVK